MEIGEKLKVMRTEKDYTLKQLAALSGLSISFISDIENGRRKPGLDNLEKLVAVLGSSLYDFHGTNVISSLTYGKRDENSNSVNESSSGYDDLAELYETLHKRPEMQALFSASKHATKEDIERAIKIIEALKNE